MYLARRRSGAVITCEHASKRIPPELRMAFQGSRRVVDSHRGIDFGALALARDLARCFEAPLIAGEVSRLVVDVNRSLRHRGLFSEWSRKLDGRTRAAVVARYWQTYRELVEQALHEQMRVSRPLLHVSVHTFTPRWNGKTRKVDVALLYAPARAREKSFASDWLAAIHSADPGLRLRRNYPYRGDSDGLTTSIRRRFGEREYVGIELELSQRFPLGSRPRWTRLRQMLARTLLEVVDRTIRPTPVSR